MDRLLWNKQWHKHCDYYYGHGGTNNINAKEGVLNSMSYSTAIMVIVLSCKLNGELFFCEQEKYEKKMKLRWKAYVSFQLFTMILHKANAQLEE